MLTDGTITSQHALVRDERATGTVGKVIDQIDPGVILRDHLGERSDGESTRILLEHPTRVRGGSE